MPTETKNRSTERVTLSVDKTDGHIQVSINVVDDNYYGHGYRLVGPKYDGRSTQVAEVTLTQRDVQQVMAYLRKVPQIEVTFYRGWENATAPGHKEDNWHWSVYDLGREVAKGFDPVEDVARAAAEAALAACNEAGA